MHLLKLCSLILLSIGLMVAGTLHLTRPAPFKRIVPPSLPAPGLLVAISGVAELLLGIALLVPRLSHLAAWGCICLFVAVFPANIFLFQHQELLPAPPILHLARLPLQGVLILWAYWHTRP